MAKLTLKNKEEILRDYAVGMGVREIAKKFTVSPTAISKILSSAKSLQNGKKSLQKQDNAEIARQIINKAMSGLLKEIDKAPVRDKLKAIEQLSVIYNIEEMSDNVDEIIVEIEDASEADDGAED